MPLGGLLVGVRDLGHSHAELSPLGTIVFLWFRRRALPFVELR